MIISSVCAFAASSTSGYCGNIRCTGSLSFGTNRATATTTAVSSSVACTASVTYKYQFGSMIYEESAENTYPSSSVTATAIAGLVPAQNISAIGTHYVYASGSTWYGYTSI
ncbi:hypothetical protein [Anaerobacterium chartisolvens]|nr:hypothetical protein [Anaerobacterium chartisolvens]